MNLEGVAGEEEDLEQIEESVMVVTDEEIEEPVLEVDVKSERRNPSQVELMVDSGSYRHVAPLWFAAETKLEPEGDARGLPVTADGRALRALGQRRVRYRLSTGEAVESNFLVMDVKRPILSAVEMCRNGAELKLNGNGGKLLWRGRAVPLVRRGNLQFLPVMLGQKDARTLSTSTLVTSPRPWMLYEWACEGNSRLARWFVHEGHGAVRLHLPEHDLCDHGCVGRLVEEIAAARQRGFNIMVWAALPCTAWSRWQVISVTRSASTREHIEKEKEESIRMVREFQWAWAMKTLKSVGVPVEIAFEWPRGAEGWTQPVVQEMRRICGLEVECDFDGCQYNLRDLRGRLLQKPWKVVTTLVRLREPLSKRCSNRRDGTRNHEHGECRGRDAQKSARYSEKLVDVIGRAITGGPNQGILCVAALRTPTQPSEPTEEER